MDYRDKLRELIEAHCKRHGISRYTFCKTHGVDHGTLSGILNKHKGVSLELFLDLLSFVEYEIEFKHLPKPDAGPVYLPKPKPKKPELVNYPRRRSGRPKGAKNKPREKQTTSAE